MFQGLRLVENQANRLRAWRRRAPPGRLCRNEDRLDWIILVFRRDLDHGCTLKIEPAFTARWNSLRSRSSNKPLTHINTVYLWCDSGVYRFVRSADAEVRHKSFADRRSSPRTQGQLSLVPSVQFTHDENVFGIGSPYREISSFPILHLDPVGSQLFIEVVVSSLL